MKVKKPQVILASIIPRALTKQHAYNDLKELKDLVETFGGEVADIIIQHREVHDKGGYLGEGKIHEIANTIEQKKIDIVVLNAIVIPGHIFDMKKVFLRSNPSIEVWDRTDLILQLFAKQAHTAESKLQIELAAMRHMGPRIYGMGMELSRQRGGIGTRGIGETNTERMKRHWREQMKKTNDKLGKLLNERKRQIEHRKRLGLQTASLIGYTNAGKTSLFNLLTNKNKLVQNALFVTLDSVTGKMILPLSQKEILISDTIGFIKNLPPDLIEAFKSTLLESVHADLLLHIIDASDEEIQEKITAVEMILKDLGLQHKKRLYVFNKIDKVEKVDQIFKKHLDSLPIQYISVINGEGIEELATIIEQMLYNTQQIPLEYSM